MTAPQTSTGTSSSWKTSIMAASAGLLALASVGFATAQDATPETTSRSSISAVGVLNTDGFQIGTVIGSETQDGLSLTINVSNLPPGEHGLHIHETGVCDVEGDPPFDSAGGHFNPTGASHGPGNATIVPLVSEGTPVPEAPASPVADGTESHAGDLGNVTVQDNGRLSVAVTTSSVTLAPGAETSLADADGSALVIHAGADDLHSDPSGESGDRIACAVLFAPMDGMAPAATPEG